ncbi:MAG: 4-(cytidine 5'-diphospho)-2-C-methyl-D-erythritol kinase [Clostridia bacterium]|nr:4-(cytidine 5'-diphospho)-2-C-methyl-D-erythritol kinase [Clostridia bacterium]
MESVTKKAHAKINLHLDINGVMQNGFHSVINVMQSVSLCDTVTLVRRDDTDITVKCNVAGVPDGRQNLAVRALIAYCETRGISIGADIIIDKQIPMQAGLAGGSADAAAVLLAVNELCSSPLDMSELCKLGGMLGADIPFCIVGGTALAEGKGDILHDFPSMPDCVLVVACGGEGVSTPMAFSMLDEIYNGFVSDVLYTPHSISALKSAMSENDIIATAKSLYNIFEQPILSIRPVASNLRRIMLSSGAVGAMMSGSGPSVFGIFTSEEKAFTACATIKKIGVEPHMCRPIRR